MIAPNCPDHGRTVLDLALGRLDDEAALQAEGLLDTCPVCRDWWQEQFGGEDVATVDAAVAEIFNGLELPTRRRSHGWMAVAAVAVMTLGVAGLWLARAPQSVQPVAPELTASIQTMDFEIPDDVVLTPPADPVVEQTEATAAVETAPVELETEIVVAESVAVEAPAKTETEPLFAGGFESGDLSDWATGI